MDGYRLIDIEAGVVEASSTDIEIELTNNTQAVTMTSSPLVIPGGDLFSDLDAPSPVAAGDDAIVAHGDQLWINVVDAGDGGAMGLEVILVFV
jgi:hypothetical protein